MKRHKLTVIVGLCAAVAMAALFIEPALFKRDKQASPLDPTANVTKETRSAKAILIAPERQQLIGVKSVAAVVKSLTKEIRTFGKVAYDETRITHVHTKVTGYIEEVFVNYTGQLVKTGDPLFTIYSPDLVATQEEYLLALKSHNVLKDSSFPWVSNGSDNLLEATRRRLLFWDVSDQDVRTLEREGKVKRAMTIHSPASGVVTERAAYHHGKYVNPEMDLYTIVDLSTVWVLGEIYQEDLANVREGQMAEVEFPYGAARKSRLGKIVQVYPFLNPKTRTAQIRIAFSNPDLVLRPDMFLNITLRINYPARLAVPEDSVLDTGSEQYVFVDKGEGYFEPRLVKLGPQAGGFYAIEKGLTSGERVVTAANFILDSESRLKGAFANMGKPEVTTQQAQASTQKLTAQILYPKEAKVGANDIRLAVKDSSGKPIDGAEVEVRLFMPQMGSMPPMTTTARLQSAGNGEYTGKIEVLMAWTWETTITVKKDGKTLGAVQTNLTAR